MGITTSACCDERESHERYPILADAFGHDSMGHRGFNAVIRNIGTGTESQVIEHFLSLTPGELRNLPTVGRMLEVTIREVQRALGSKMDPTVAQSCPNRLCARFPVAAEYFTHDKEGHRALAAVLESMRTPTNHGCRVFLAALSDEDIENMHQVGPVTAETIRQARQRMLVELEKGEEK